MKTTPKLIFRFLLVSSLIVSATVFAGTKNKGDESERSEPKSEHKTITLINAEGTADGKSEISRETVKECALSLPKIDALEAEVTTDSRFLKEINGDPNKNDWVKIVTAHITINYVIYRKEILIVATHSVEGQKPEMKDVEKRLPQVKEFISNAADGDTFAGRSNRQYYFTKTDDAVKDAKARAAVWLKQQAPLVCTDTK